MAFEIERKFLVRGDAWRPLVSRETTIRQAYLSRDGKASIRVRISDESAAALTIKSRTKGQRRLEMEYDIPVIDAEALMSLREGAVVQKVRHLVPWGDLTWEIDVFSGENAGLTIAEIELQRVDQVVSLPEWIGPEVTGQAQFYNSALAQTPFSHWTSPDQRRTIAG